MADVTKIEWTDSTFNPWVGCTKITPACDHCYAESWAKRSGMVEWGGARRRTSPSLWREPLKWQKQAGAFLAEHGRRRRVFCASLADVFDNQVPIEWRSDLFAIIRSCPDLDWQLLTKRPQNIPKMLPEDWGGGYHNVWLGATCENQENYDRNWLHLSAIPATVLFVSYEPALGALVVKSIDGKLPDWLIVGGESGPQARENYLCWTRAAIQQCERLGIACLVKQLGARPRDDDGIAVMIQDKKGGDWTEWPADLRVRQWPIPALSTP